MLVTNTIRISRRPSPSEQVLPMIRSIIVATSINRVIGRNNVLPWHLPADLAHFKSVTMGKPVVMGRKTWESIGKPLPGRTNVVVTHDKNYQADGALVVGSLAEAESAAEREHGDIDELMIIGGATLYDEVIDSVDRIYLTEVNEVVEGDTWFPDIDVSDWREVSREDFEADDKNPFDYSFIVLDRC